VYFIVVVAGRLISVICFSGGAVIALSDGRLRGWSTQSTI